MNAYLELVADTLLNLTVTHDLEIIDNLLRRVKEKGTTVYLVGNGGSAALASHLVADFEKNAGLRATALSDNQSIITAYGNDSDFVMAYANRLDVLLNPEDLVILISSSATSPNLIEAAKVACHKGAYVVGLLGNYGGALREYCDAELLINSRDTQVTEDINSVFLHLIFRRLVGDSPRELLTRNEEIYAPDGVLVTPPSTTQTWLADPNFEITLTEIMEKYTNRDFSYEGQPLIGPRNGDPYWFLKRPQFPAGVKPVVMSMSTWEGKPEVE